MSKSTLRGFDGLTGRPKDPDQHRAWQQANQEWWEHNPMRYNWKEALASEPLSSAFFEEIDRRFLSQACEYLPPSRLPFGTLIPYADLPTLDCLEIGVGCGTHAALLAAHAKRFTGIDLTEQAIACTKKRFELAGLRGDLRRADAEAMDLADGSFDFIWSWGVIHHSADTGRALAEMRRVLRPGGRAVVMVYCRNFWNYYVHGLCHGFFRGILFKDHSLRDIMQLQTDGALARFYTPSEWRREATPCFVVDRIQVFGQKSDLIPLPSGRIKKTLLEYLPDPLARLFTHRLGLGSFLVANMRR